MQSKLVVNADAEDATDKHCYQWL